MEQVWSIVRNTGCKPAADSGPKSGSERRIGVSQSYDNSTMLTWATYLFNNTHADM